MNRSASFLLLSIALFMATESAAVTERRLCAARHLTRSNGTELIYTVINLRNADAAAHVSIDRLTIRDYHGDIVHDSGPASPYPTPHPQNEDVGIGIGDISFVPPQASYYFKTQHIWGPYSFGPGGYNMTVLIEFTTSGDPNLFLASADIVARELIPPKKPPEKPTEGSGRFFDSAACTKVP